MDEELHRAGDRRQHSNRTPIGWSFESPAFCAAQFATEPTADAFGVLSTLFGKYYAPTPTVLAAYSVASDSDVAPAAFDLLPQPAWTADVGALAFLCSADVACRGFNSHGWLKAGNFTARNVTSSPGCDLYLKRG